MTPHYIWKDDTDYEEKRVGRIFNQHRPARYPSGILMATSVDDVVHGVNLAKERNLKITIRSGGHSWPAWSLREGSLLIDLENLEELTLNEDTGILTCSPSSTGWMINVDYLSKFGRMFAGGHCPSVAVGGFLLQGGQGWNCRGNKWSCELIESMDVVTADGRLVTASATENADLFWAARGAGLGFFGVVVRFRLVTAPLKPVMAKSIVILDASHYDAALEWFIGACERWDLDTELVFLGLSRYRCLRGSAGDPDEPLLVISATTWKATEGEARQALALMGECPGLDRALVHVPYESTSFKGEYEIQERDNPPDCRFFCNNAWLNGNPKELLDTMRRGFLELPTKDSYTLYFSQAPLRKLPDMAFSIQTPHYYATYLMSVDSTGTEDALCRSWLATTFALIDAKRGGPGGSPGQYLGDSDLASRPAKFMTDANWAKWVKIRAKWDPERRFFGYGVAEGGTENEHLWERKEAAAAARL